MFAPAYGLRRMISALRAGRVRLGTTDTKKGEAQPFGLRLSFGAGGRGRTDTVSLPLDFESSTSANSITPANIGIIAYRTSKINTFFKKIQKNKNKGLFDFTMKKMYGIINAVSVPMRIFAQNPVGAQRERLFC